MERKLKSPNHNINENVFQTSIILPLYQKKQKKKIFFFCINKVSQKLHCSAKLLEARRVKKMKIVRANQWCPRLLRKEQYMHRQYGWPVKHVPDVMMHWQEVQRIHRIYQIHWNENRALRSISGIKIATFLPDQQHTNKSIRLEQKQYQQMIINTPVIKQ